MSLVFRMSKFLKVHLIKPIRCYHDDDGVRDMGGKWEERERAFEAEYFTRKDRECIEKLRKKLKKKKKRKGEDDDKKQDEDEKHEEEIQDDF